MSWISLSAVPNGKPRGIAVVVSLLALLAGALRRKRGLGVGTTGGSNMSDSRLTQAVAEVQAAIELIDTARNTMYELLAEDPSFTFPVQDMVQKTATQLFRADLAAEAGLRLLQSADRIENAGVA